MHFQFPRTWYEADLSGLVDSLPGLTGFPSVIQRASRLAKEPQTSASDLAAVIGDDPLLAAGILRLANSPPSGPAHRVSSLRECVVALGFSAVRSLGIVIIATNMLRGADSLLFRYGDFWMHSLCTALLAQRLSRSIGISAADDAFAAGFLHDIGKAILHQFARDPFTHVLSVQQEREALDPEIESRFLNTTHMQIGCLLAEKWHLPACLCDAIDHHHGTSDPGAEPAFTAICSISDYLCSIHGAGSLPSVGCPPRPELHFPNLACDSKAVRAVEAKFEHIRKEAQAFLAAIQGAVPPVVQVEGSRVHTHSPLPWHRRT
ncbi:MAG TPA: HDOD domain-containing protein [Planctomycetota bacterium]|nr:HDOD domain-containing protein [Planctomycetota bacterium]